MVSRSPKPWLCCTALALLAGAVIHQAGSAQTGSTNWTQWRGPSRDGRLPQSVIPTAWPQKLNKKWAMEVGEGHSSPIIADGSVYDFARHGDNEVVRRVQLPSGTELWKKEYPAPYEMNPAARGHGKGPKSTPLLADGRLYTFGISGILSCFSAADGAMIWRHEFSKEHKATSPLFGTAMSPILYKGLLVAHVGGNDDGAITAFDAKTGDVRWRWTGDGPAYASPIIVTVSGTPQIVTQTQKMCVGLAPDSGKLLWSVPFTTPFSQNSISPVAAGDLIVFAGVRTPTLAVKVIRAGDGWKAEKAWDSSDVTMYMSTAVFSNGRLYGMSERRNGQLFILDAVSGKTIWTSDGRFADNAAIFDAGPNLVVESTGADLKVYKKGDAALSEIASYHIGDSPTWASPAFAGRLIVTKDKTTMTAWELPQR